MSRHWLIESTSVAQSAMIAAISYARAGLRPTPLIGGKPRLRGWQVERFLESEADVRGAWRRDDDGVGLVAGPCSLGDLVAIVAHGEHGRATLRALNERHDRPPPTLTSTSEAENVLCLIYRVVVPRASSARLLSAYGRSSDRRPIERRDRERNSAHNPREPEGTLKPGHDGGCVCEEDDPPNLIRNLYDTSDSSRRIPGVEVCVRGSFLPAPPTAGRRWTRPMLPADLPDAWYEALVEATNR